MVRLVISVVAVVCVVDVVVPPCGVGVVGVFVAVEAVVSVFPVTRQVQQEEVDNNNRVGQPLEHRWLEQ